MTPARPKLSVALWLMVVCGCLIGMIAFGSRSSFGLFVDPVSNPNAEGSFGFGREAFAIAMAIQNLAWGIGQPIAGALADRFGPWRVIAGGGVIFAAGLFLSTISSDPLSYSITAGLLIGIGISGAGHNTVLAAFGQLLPPERRSWAMGLGTATASLGQFLVVPLGQAFIEAYGWVSAMMILALSLATTPILALALRPRKEKKSSVQGTSPTSTAFTMTSTAGSLKEAIRQAFGHTSFWLLVSGFFVCGFQLAFVTVHLPPYLSDLGISARTASWAIAMVGLFNVVGAYMAGIFCARYSRRLLLSWIYFLRAVVTAGFLLLPISPTTTLIFGALLGLLWLSTVPPTVQLVGVMFGNKYLSTLFGFVFLSHQIGGFVGVLLGGYLYTRMGTYDVVWWMSVALAIFAAIVHLPIRERLFSPKGAVPVAG
ncbi:MAG: MFS transporter [Burkholderiaceae bacterium]